MSALFQARDLQAGGIAAGHASTAEAGARILDAGGSALDAAIAALVAAFIVEPVFASPGGGGFMTIRQPDGTVRVLDFFVDLPAKKNRDADIREVTADFGTVKQPFAIGAGTVAVPGMAKAFDDLLALTSPSVKVEQIFGTALDAVSQVTISPFQAKLFQIVAPILTASSDARAIFAPSGAMLAKGDKFSNPNLVHHLERIRDHGHPALADLFANEAILAQQSDGGQLSPDDLEAYAVTWRDPICWRGRDFRAFANPGPAFGGTLALAMLANLDAAGDTQLNRACAIRSVDQNWRQGRSAEEIADRYDLARPAIGQLAVKDGVNGTTHISVIDRKGCAVAITVTNGEGNGLVVGNCGYMLNNMLGEEDVNPAGPDGWKEQPLGQRRLSSMMTPTIVEGADGRVISLGSGGSNRIRTAIFQVLANCVLTGMDLKEAIVLPRLHGEKQTLDVEDCAAQAGWEALDGVFEKTVPWHEQSLYFGGVHGVERDARGRFSGAGDPRREGAFLLVD